MRKVISVLAMLMVSSVLYSQQLPLMNLKIYETNNTGEAVIKWENVKDASHYFVRVFDTGDVPSYAVNILKMSNFNSDEAGSAKMLQMLNDRAVFSLTDTNKVLVSGLKSKDYFVIVTACVSRLGKYYYKMIAASEITGFNPKYDIFSWFRKKTAVNISPNLIEKTSISEVSENPDKFTGKTIEIEGTYVYKEDFPVTVSDIHNEFYITDGKYKIGCSMKIGLPVHPELDRLELKAKSPKDYAMLEKKFNKEVSGAYRARVIGSIIKISDIPKKEKLKELDNEMWLEMLTFQGSRPKNARAILFSYYAQNLGVSIKK
ncbi:MAG: hypothetical protein A2452_00500 [Candidatus Firestonebacteria bacterium RIFOXYC2_FULL_39_67]|nr:MAG: hypothetical protein A2536_03585 [Candidatus Firestonebacteria bacterium RIFOXYD2_FULL_39_29]OGF54912.1 MAG: hypothetical protein A2452_00500 [Candidatus Firestonebacteria bacterium RIFOXYC2_FULL_39_67]OGF57742.1 MAG: hypothetical protein A2497_03885 [Candidatus Firestonebacteria bacterium RifOxyC12_full_39_7]